MDDTSILAGVVVLGQHVRSLIHEHRDVLRVVIVWVAVMVMHHLTGL